MLRGECRLVWAGYVRKSDPLNARQLDVLRRISSGENVGSGSTAKTSARALHDRGLVAVSTRGGWHAEVTDAGHFYLDHGHHPDRPCGTGAPCADKNSKSQLNRQPVATPPKRRPPHVSSRIAPQRRTAAAELIARLVDQKRIVITNPNDYEIAEWRKVVDFAKRNGMVPADHRIEQSRWRSRDLRIELHEGPHPNTKPSLDPSQRIEVPEHIERLHPLLSHLKDPAAVLDVSPEQLPRALRIIHTVLTEAEHHGYETGWADDTSAGVEIRAGRFRLHVTLTEEWEKRDVVPTPDELAGKKLYDWQRFQPETKSVRSGKLRLQVATNGIRWDRPAWWADRQRWSVEDKLGEVLTEITSRVQAEQHRIDAEEQAKLQRQRDWEAAMGNARARFQEDRRIDRLTKQLDRWEKAAVIRAYCAALEGAQLPDLDAEEAGARSGWLEWCRSYADRIDPTKTGACAPQETEPKPSDLQPYLGRFSPYGP